MADEKKSLHTICRWTFNPGKGGFVPGDMRPEWGSEFTTVDMINLVSKDIAPRLPDNVKLGLEMHYANEVDEKTAPDVADASVDTKIPIAMTTPGAHVYNAYGGSASLDPDERARADDLGQKAVDLTYGPLKKAWDKDAVPTLVLWNGSWGYDVQSPGIARMKANLRESISNLVKYEQSKGGLLYKAIEPKGNEGHPAMAIATVGEALNLWRTLVSKYALRDEKLGLNQEFGHTQMLGLDIISEIDDIIVADALVHMHLNSQGGEAGLLGGAGKYDIDNGAQISEANVSVAYLIQRVGYDRWKGHDMQTRAYDNVPQAVDRVVRSVLSWEACEMAARTLDMDLMGKHLAGRNTAAVQDMMQDAVQVARQHFKDMYKA